MKIGQPADKPTAPNLGAGEAAASGTRAAPLGTGGMAASAAAAGAAGTPGDAGAKIELSSAASTLLAGAGAAEFDAEKVARLSKAIEAGSFKVDPQAIADKLIASAHELLGRVKT